MGVLKSAHVEWDILIKDLVAGMQSGIQDASC